MPELVSDDQIKRNTMARLGGLIRSLIEAELDPEVARPTEQQVRYAFEAMMDFWYPKGGEHLEPR